MQKKTVATLAVVMMMAVPVCSFAVIANNEVTSVKIKDGEVKTADIADAAVTTAKIAAGAVTDAKITGPISVSKLPVGTTSTTLAAGNHNHDTVYTKKSPNIVVVAKSGGDFTSPVAAMASITAASATNPYLVKVMPGVYDLGTASLQMKEFVDFEGSGSEVTTVISSNNNAAADLCTTGTVLMANNMAIRNIAVVNSAPNLSGSYDSPVVGIAFNNVAAKAEGITVLVGSETTPGGKNIGVCSYGDSAKVQLNNVYIETRNMLGQNSSVRYMGGAVTVQNSTLIGKGGSVQLFNNDASYTGTVTVANSTMVGTSPDDMVTAFTSDGVFGATVINSTINLSSGNVVFPFHAFHTDKLITVENSQINVTGPNCEFTITPTDTRIANSRISSQCTGLVGARMFNNHDEDFKAYPVQ